MATHCGRCDGSGADVCGRYGKARMTDKERVRILRSAMQTFYTWATFDCGRMLYPADVAALSAKALARTGAAPATKQVKEDPCSRR